MHEVYRRFLGKKVNFFSKESCVYNVLSSLPSLFHLLLLFLFFVGPGEQYEPQRTPKTRMVFPIISQNTGTLTEQLYP